MLTLNFSELENTNGTKFLVGIDDIEPTENGQFQYIFDGVEEKWFQEFQEQDVLQVYEKMNPIIFIGNFPIDISSRIKKLIEQKILSRWILIDIVDYKTDFPVTQFAGDNSESEGILRYVSSISILRGANPTSIALNNFFSWNSFPQSDKIKIQNVLKQKKGAPSSFKLNVYNVGQGSLCSIASPDNIPLIYYDMGGGWQFHKRTYPNTKRLCFTEAETIIISHWDWDHLETARRYSSTQWLQFHGKNWIVPKQNLTSSYMKLACKMATTGNLLVWPSIGLSSLSFWAGEIILCNGPEKNHSGLALIVDSPSNSIDKVLHPADAAYTYIPGIMAQNFTGIVATHHGANFDINNAPIPVSTNGNIAYSHANRYGHPTALSVAAHNTAGWTSRRDTTSGDISFTINTGVLSIPCGGTNCDLAIVQEF